VKGFSEALIEDLRVNAPHVRVMLVMPGHVGTNIVGNSLRAHGVPDPASLTVEELEQARQALAARGLPVDGVPAAELGQVLAKLNDNFRDSAPLTAAAAATIILDGVRSGAWRVLVGEDAKLLDTFIRANPERSYDYDEMAKAFGGDPALSGGLADDAVPVSSAPTRSDSRQSKVIISRSAPSPSPAFSGTRSPTSGLPTKIRRM